MLEFYEWANSKPEVDISRLYQKLPGAWAFGTRNRWQLIPTIPLMGDLTPFLNLLIIAILLF